MNVKIQTEKDQPQSDTSINTIKKSEADNVLCSHCLRTASNGIKCKGICVSDNDY